jgi:hypothetical protein
VRDPARLMSAEGKKMSPLHRKLTSKSLWVKPACQLVDRKGKGKMEKERAKSED